MSDSEQYENDSQDSISEEIDTETPTHQVDAVQTNHIDNPALTPQIRIILMQLAQQNKVLQDAKDKAEQEAEQAMLAVDKKQRELDTVKSTYTRLLDSFGLTDEVVLTLSRQEKSGLATPNLNRPSKQYSPAQLRKRSNMKVTERMVRAMGTEVMNKRELFVAMQEKGMLHEGRPTIENLPSYLASTTEQFNTQEGRVVRINVFERVNTGMYRVNPEWIEYKGFNFESEDEEETPSLKDSVIHRATRESARIDENRQLRNSSDLLRSQGHLA